MTIEWIVMKIDWNGHKVSDPAIVKILEDLSGYFAEPVVVTSGDRSHVPQGGSTTSLHLKGRAVDFHVKGVSDRLVFEALKDQRLFDKGYEVIRHGQYTVTGGPHIHIGHYLDESRESTFRFEGVNKGQGYTHV